MARNNKFINFFFSWTPVLIWGGLIYYLSSLPNLTASQHPLWDELIRNFLHFLFYFIFYLLCARAVKEKKNKKQFAFW
ncbi:VanZ family protein, partial [Patescibacteria group bacterium]